MPPEPEDLPMPQQNLEQLRAAHALAYWSDPKNHTANQGAEGGEVVSKLPALIINNGLLATAAFAKSKGGGYEAIILRIFQHLARVEIGVYPAPVGFRQGDGQLDPHLRELTARDSTTLQRATAEALAYLSYLKRFAP
jgi:CRISPR-associated protein Cmr5